jgi:hypothetical protein
MSERVKSVATAWARRERRVCGLMSIAVSSFRYQARTLGTAVARTVSGVGHGEAAVRLPQIAGAYAARWRTSEPQAAAPCVPGSGPVPATEETQALHAQWWPLSQTTAANQEWALDLHRSCAWRGRTPEPRPRPFAPLPPASTQQ